MCHTVSNLHSRNVPALLYLFDWVCFTDKLESSFQDIICQFNISLHILLLQWMYVGIFAKTLNTVFFLFEGVRNFHLRGMIWTYYRMIYVRNKKWPVTTYIFNFEYINITFLCFKSFFGGTSNSFYYAVMDVAIEKFQVKSLRLMACLLFICRPTAPWWYCAVTCCVVFATLWLTGSGLDIDKRSILLNARLKLSLHNG